MLMVKCPTCDGRGKIADANKKTMDKSKECTTCYGTGKVDFHAVSEDVREALYRQYAS